MPGGKKSEVDKPDDNEAPGSDEKKEKALKLNAQVLYFTGAPGRIRTCDLRIRSPALYPLSYGRKKRLNFDSFISYTGNDVNGNLNFHDNQPAQFKPEPSVSNFKKV